VGPEIAAQQLAGEQRGVLERVGLGGQRGPRAHRERERLVLLDEIEEALRRHRRQRRVGDVGRPPGGGDERVLTAARDRRRLAPEHDLDGIKDAVEPAVGLQRGPPGARQRPDRIDGDDAHACARLSQALGQRQLGDVAPEEVLEIHGRDQQIDPRWSGWISGEAQRRHLVVHHPGGLVDPGASGLHDQRGGRLSVESQVPGRARSRAERQQAAPGQGVGEHPLGPERLGSGSQQLAQASQGEPQ
jgi:hypothetical protein